MGCFVWGYLFQVNFWGNLIHFKLLFSLILNSNETLRNLYETHDGRSLNLPSLMTWISKRAISLLVHWLGDEHSGRYYILVEKPNENAVKCFGFSPLMGGGPWQVACGKTGCLLLHFPYQLPQRHCDCTFWERWKSYVPGSPSFFIWTCYGRWI